MHATNTNDAGVAARAALRGLLLHPLRPLWEPPNADAQKSVAHSQVVLRNRISCDVGGCAEPDYGITPKLPNN